MKISTTLPIFFIHRGASVLLRAANLLQCADDDSILGSETLDGNAGVTVGSAEGFNTLAGYLFGNNTQEVSMDMTTPVNIDVSPTGGRWASNHCCYCRITYRERLEDDVKCMSTTLGRMCHVFLELDEMRRLAVFVKLRRLPSHRNSTVWYCSTVGRWPFQAWFGPVPAPRHFLNEAPEANL